MQSSIRIQSRQGSMGLDSLHLAGANRNRVLMSLLLITLISQATAGSAEAQVVPSQCMIVGDYHGRMAAGKEAVRNACRREMRQAGMAAQNSQMQIGRLSEQLRAALSEQNGKILQKDECEEELRKARHALSEIKNEVLAADENSQLPKATASLEESEDYQEALKQVREAQDRLDQAKSDLKRTSLAVVSLKRGLARNQQVLKTSRSRFAQAKARMP